MSKIQVMSEALSNRIAAGEVIERPASVVKELVENSIDAGSSFVEIEIERAGSRLIAVTDDGCGMDREDALLSLSQHGTSKLLSDADLNSIMTLGFRGEALPSIASVSRFKLMTRQADSAEGTAVSCDGGSAAEVVPCGGSPGTRIEVRDLFFNLPARKKFLKSAATEEHHIEEMISLLAIGHPETGFRLKMDNRVVFHSPASGKIEIRLRELFGKSFVDRMLFFEHRESGIYLSGCVAAPGFTRPSRRDQRTFINSRAVESQAIFRGIRDGYGTLAEPGRYNPVVIFMEIDPQEVDVNVHPAKREVRFRFEYRITQAVAAAVSGALRQMRSPETLPASGDSTGLPLSGKLPLSLVLDAAEVRYKVPDKVQPELPVVPQKSPDFSAEKDHSVRDYSILTDRDGIETYGSSGRAERFDTVVVSEPESTVAVGNSEAVENLPPLFMDRNVKSAAFTGNWPERIIGVLDKTYILAEAASGLAVIDQHAAHERVMFEKLILQATENSAVQQQLLLPQTIELPRSAVSLVLKNRNIFEQLGFDVESAGNCTLMINSIPQTLDNRADVESLFADMIHELLENSGNRLPIALEYVARAACRAAVKAHDELSFTEMEILLRDLRNCRQGTLCPHGRPTIIAITTQELERRFARK